VFIACPHRGSNTANRAIGRLTSALVRPSSEIAALRSAVTALNGLEIFQPTYRTRMMSSLDNLEPESPVLQTLASLPITPGVPYHSIIGNISPSPNLSNWTDGVVRYESARLDGATSELVVPHTHSSITGKPLVVAEVSRLLKQHLRELVRDTAPTGE